MLSSCGELVALPRVSLLATWSTVTSYAVCWVCAQAPPTWRCWPEVGRYPLQAFAAQMLLKYWNRLVGMDADRLTKRAFVVSAALARRTVRRSRHMPWAGQAAAAIESLGLQCDPVSAGVGGRQAGSGQSAVVVPGHGR